MSVEQRMNAYNPQNEGEETYARVRVRELLQIIIRVWPLCICRKDDFVAFCLAECAFPFLVQCSQTDRARVTGPMTTDSYCPKCCSFCANEAHLVSVIDVITCCCCYLRFSRVCVIGSLGESRLNVICGAEMLCQRNRWSMLHM